MSLDDSCVQDLVQRQAYDTPDALAIVSGSDHLTYGQLNVRANELAHRLSSLGIRPEVPVGLCIERSVELAVGALGILKAGGAYVALDPADPPNRLAVLLEESGVSTVVTRPAVAAKIPAGKWHSILLDLHSAGRNPDALSPAPFPPAPSNLAYIIFTSGSTGKPKGVEVTHGNLLNLVAWHQRAFHVSFKDRAILQASPGFDAAVWELWPYLTAGATVYVVDDAVRIEPTGLRDWIVRNGITIGFLPTQLAECMMGLQWPADSAFKTLLTGADVLRRRPPQGLPFTVVNNYGPTECTVVSTSGEVKPVGEAGALAIGRPIDNVDLYIVDEQLRRVPDGTPGELLVGGRGVARGYLNSPQATADKFIRDLFSGNDGARLYRTGDLGRVLPNGQIAFMGRIDDQIKVMGHRIEPQEIVSALDRHPAVAASFVCGLSDVSENQRLVAYIVAAKNASPKPGEIRNFLSSHLPVHMVPSTFVQLAQLPTTARGKLDRSALPRPTPENILRDESSEAPQSPIEDHLTAVLSSLLGGIQVGAHDNFFTLGGHSLLGAQLIARIRENFGVEISLRKLFEEPTVRGMAVEIERLIHTRLAAMTDDEAERLLASSKDRV
jgi:amino acid adenylation domain-containing protein